MDITDRLTELAHAVADNNWSEFSMRIPAEPERDADLVLLRAAKEIESLRAELAECRENLCDMVLQFFIQRDDDGTISHSFMSAEEHAISYLLKAGLAEEVSRYRYRLINAARKGEGG